MAECPHCGELHDTGTDYCPRTGRPVADVATRMIGRTIAGKYRLIRCIGQGGMGTIFEAKHSMIGNRMAVKMLHEPFAASREPVQRLYREARATGTIGHPNIIQVFDVGETAEGTPFLVMELLEGESLGDHLENNGPRPLGFVLDVGVQMLSALHAAHEAGVIHRDLKCDNIFLVPSDQDELRIKLLDFGVSKFITPGEEGLKLTQTGSVLGTPYYMSPEQASGDKDLDHRLDIYAAGVILYETLTGSVPHRASNYNALLMEILSHNVKPFGWQRPDMPASLERAVLKAMARNREDRWPRALDFMEALTEIRDGLSAVELSNQPELVRDNAPPHGERTSRDAETIGFESTLREEEQETPFTISTVVEDQPGDAPASTLGRRRVLAWTGALLGVVAAVGIILFGTLGEHPASDGLEMLASAPPTGDGGLPEVDSRGDAQVPGDEAGGDVTLRVVGAPPDAEITIDGREVPEEGLVLERGDAPVTLEVLAEGYAAFTSQVVPEEDRVIEVALEQERPAERVEPGRRPGGRARPKRQPRDEATAPSKGEPEMGQPAPKRPRPKRSPKKAMDRPMDNPF